MISLVLYAPLAKCAADCVPQRAAVCLALCAAVCVNFATECVYAFLSYIHRPETFCLFHLLFRQEVCTT